MDPCFHVLSYFCYVSHSLLIVVECKKSFFSMTLTWSIDMQEILKISINWHNPQIHSPSQEPSQEPSPG